MARAAKGQSLSALDRVRDHLANGVAAKKCHRCGCMQRTVEALGSTAVGRAELQVELDEARKVFVEKEYDCLGCRVCFPAAAANVFEEAYPEESAALDFCPTDEPEARRGWPPLPGDYRVVRYHAPVAVCTLHSARLAEALAEKAPEGLAIAGTMHTENLGVERVLQNVLANPHIRFLVLCGQETQQAIGHLPGQSLESLWRSGTDERGRIRGARGKRPILKNVRGEQVEAFRRQVDLVALIGEETPARVEEAIAACAARDPGPVEGTPGRVSVETIRSKEPIRLVPDPAGFFVVYPDSRRRMLVVDHYTKQGVLDCVVEGRTPAAVSSQIIERSLITRLDHAAYLGRELARAERSMETGTVYIQDRAPGDLGPVPEETDCGCARVGCTLSVWETVLDEDQRARHQEVAQRLYAAVEETEELEDGLAFTLPPAREFLLLATEFIARERICSPAFRFRLDVESGGGSLRIEMTGPGGAKAFLAGALLPNASKETYCVSVGGRVRTDSTG